MILNPCACDLDDCNTCQSYLDWQEAEEEYKRIQEEE